MTRTLPGPSIPLPSIEALKAQAKRLRGRLAADGKTIGDSESLELLACQYGYRDWNTLHAAARKGPPRSPVKLGSKVCGRYLGQPFQGDVIGIKALAPPGRYRVTLHFDEAVDVVTFDSFSAFRQRVTCTIDQSGRTAEKTSDGWPHLQLDL